MKVSELMEWLQDMPADADVRYMYDGIEAKPADCCWMSQDGDVVLCEKGDPVYDNENRPTGAPDADAEDIRTGFWRAGEAIKL